MNDLITLKSIGKGIAEVEEDFILSEEPMSRLVFSAQIHNGGIRGKIIRQRRESAHDIWVADKAINIRSLGRNESINIEVNTEAVNKLFSSILKLSNILRDRGVRYGEHQYAVVNPDSVVITDANKVTYIKKLLEAGYDEAVWDGLVESNPSLVTKLSRAQVFAERKKVVEEFEASLLKDNDENYWQSFFHKNCWIFGYGLRYQFLNLITEQPRYAGANYKGTGEQRGDYLMNSEAKRKFTVLVEIKKPQTALVGTEKYRAGCWKLGEELLWAVSQVQMNCLSWFRDGSRNDATRDDLETQQIYTYNPKGILVMGHTGQLNERDKIQTFEAYRRALNNPEIITFDELFERAKFLVANAQD